MKLEDVKKLKIAIVDDFLTIDGGAQCVLRVMHDIWPQAPVYTVTYFPESFDPCLKDWDIRTSFVNKLPFRKILENQYKVFYQIAIEQFDLSEYDFVLSQTYAGYAKGVVIPQSVKHLCYVHNVPRYLWGLPTSRHSKLGFLYKKIILPPLEHYWRIWDRQTAERPDKLVANSQNVSDRIKKFYRCNADVLYPPVDVEKLLKVPSSRIDDYWVYFGRLEEYKRVDMAIRACVSNKMKLKIIGVGNYMNDLKSFVNDLGASDYIEFMGWLSDSERNKIISGSKAFIFPCTDEDFGIAPVEAMALGKPVIAFNSGGVKETVVNGKTGFLLDEFSIDSLINCLKGFKSSDFNTEDCRNQARKFSKEVFKENLLKIISQML